MRMTAPKTAGHGAVPGARRGVSWASTRALHLTGYGIVEKNGNRLTALSYGVVRTPAGLELHERLAQLFDELSALLARYQPTVRRWSRCFST